MIKIIVKSTFMILLNKKTSENSEVFLLSLKLHYCGNPE